MSFHYVYIIVSRNRPEKYYIGFTENLDDRLRHHNHGAVPPAGLAPVEANVEGGGAASSSLKKGCGEQSLP